MSEKQWAGTTYGSSQLHNWLIRLLKYVDVRVVYAISSLMVVPVCLVLNPSRRTTYHFMRRRMGYSRLRSAWLTYTNHCLFGQVVIDRFAMYAGKHFDIELEGYDHYVALAKRDESFIQLSAHVGNYEIAGYTLTVTNKPLNALVFWGEKASVMENRTKMFSNTKIKMIPVRNDMSHLFEIDHAIQQGEPLSMPADRIWGSQKYVTVSFLGADAQFPLGPFSVATLRGCDVVAVNVMKVASKRYKIHITPLPYDRDLPRKAQAEQLAKAYVKELERILRLYPTQWYNYYDFWKDE